jgi:hypothetical protein
MTTQTKTIFFMGLLISLFGCNRNNNKIPINNVQDSIKLTDITSRTEEGFSDVFLTIVSDTKTDTSHIYITKGLYKGRTVGLQFEVKSMINAGIENGHPSGSGLVDNGVLLKSIGKESDEFVMAMSELYKFPTTKKFSKEVISTTAISLNDKPADLTKKDIYKFKLFFAEEDEMLYSELFFNINLIDGEIELPEKDQGYRKPLIKVWTK